MGLSYLSTKLLALILLLGLTTPSLATNYTVTNTNDSGSGSLRQAILDANSTATDDTITFDTSANGTIGLQTTLTIANNGTLTITGNGATNTVLSGQNSVRVLLVNSGANLTLAGIAIIQGKAGKGGGITNSGTLTISSSTLSHNSATRDGGGISNSSGTLTISNSTLSHNSATHDGGGIFNYGTLTISNSTLSGNSATRDSGGSIYNLSGTLTISNSTISGNSATHGGGIINGDTLTISNSTISGNSATYGGGIINVDTLTISNSTISGNSATYGGGIYSYIGTLTISNSIIANSTNGGDCSRDSDGTINAQHSLIEDGLTCVNGTNSNNLIGDPALNPDLTLHAGSPAIDAGDNDLIPAGITTDLAGNPRIQNGSMDMGAYESAP